MSEKTVVQTQLDTTPNVVEEMPLPKALVKQIEEANIKIRDLQQKLQDEITESTRELMTLMGIDNKDGWYLDLEKMRFVKVDLPSAPPQPE